MDAPLCNGIQSEEEQQQQQQQQQPAAARSPDKLTAAEHNSRARQLQEELVRNAAKKEKAEFAARIKQEKEKRDALLKNKKAFDNAAEKVRVQAAAAAAVSRASYLAEEKAARVRLAETIARQEAEAAAQAKRMRDRWESKWRSAPPLLPREKADPYAEWRGTTGNDDASEESDEEESLPEGASEEEVAQALARKARAKERDVAARRILAHSSRTLMDALGLAATATDSEIESTVRRLLRLLHPDYSINLSIKGTRAHARITAAFKRLNGLRDDENT
jgi:hypothetical protein